MTKDQNQKILTENIKDYLKNEWKSLHNVNALTENKYTVGAGLFKKLAKKMVNGSPSTVVSKSMKYGSAPEVRSLLRAPLARSPKMDYIRSVPNYGATDDLLKINKRVHPVKSLEKRRFVTFETDPDAYDSIEKKLAWQQGRQPRKPSKEELDIQIANYKKQIARQAKEEAENEALRNYKATLLPQGPKLPPSNPIKDKAIAAREKIKQIARDTNTTIEDVIRENPKLSLLAFGAYAGVGGANIGVNLGKQQSAKNSNQ